MKKTCAALMTLVLVLCGIFAACADEMELSSFGLVLDTPSEGMDNVVMTEKDTGTSAYMDVAIFYFNSEALIPALTARTLAMMSNDADQMRQADEAYREQFMLHAQELYDILIVDTARMDDVAEELTGAALIGVNSTHTYYLASMPENPSLAEEDKPLLEEAREAAGKIAATIRITEIEQEDFSAASVDLSGISTADMEGNPVDASIFARAELTVLNVWDTTCNPCVAEMPALADWADELPENVQLVGLILDVTGPDSRSFESAKIILDKSGVTFVNLLYNDTLQELVYSIIGTPTTFFLDGNGRSVAEPVIGAYVEEYKRRVTEILAK